eukprot:10024868-Prorocentrum_lima.AAC.1
MDRSSYGKRSLGCQERSWRSGSQLRRFMRPSARGWCSRTCTRLSAPWSSAATRCGGCTRKPAKDRQAC